jgi:DnaJ-class molecular chaperone
MPRSRLIKLTTPAPKPIERKRDRCPGGVEVVARRCNRCSGTGQAVCTICSGAGQVVTGKDVFGRLQTTRCCGCFGTKTSRCTTCAGTGWL